MRINLHRHGAIDSNLLLGAFGLNFKRQEYKPTWRFAANFRYDFKNAAYCYPLFKTHKQDHFASVLDIPVRLVTAATNLPTTRVMAFLEDYMQPLMINYCQSEYTKDSGHYLQRLSDNDIYDLQNLVIICFDVEALYPSAQRNMVLQAVKECLEFNKITDDIISSILKLTKVCLEHIYIEFHGEYYGSDSGILTGGSNSVSLANCLLRYITRRLDLKETKIWQRFIDDIVSILQNKSRQEVKCFVERTVSHFKDFNFNLTVRTLSVENEEVQNEFLDISHKLSADGSLQTSLFVKPTATNSAFLHPNSNHPEFVSRGILYSESIRMRRICSTDQAYKEALGVLNDKARRSCFKEKIIQENLNKVQHWGLEYRKKLLNPGEVQTVETQVTTKRESYWTTSLPQQIKERFDSAKRYISNQVDTIKYTYKKPPNLRSLLFKPKKVGDDCVGASKNCGQCLLCGNRRSNKVFWQNMVNSVEGKYKGIKLKNSLDCKSKGIYVATCTICSEQYVGQTCTSFAKRWSSHRASWKKDLLNTTQQNFSKKSDETALLDHYRNEHPEMLNDFKNNKSTFGFDTAFKVTFVDDNTGDLHLKEDFWKQKLHAKLNRCNVVTPYH